MQNHFTLLLATRAAILLQYFGAALDRAWVLPYGEAMHNMLGEALLARPDGTLSIYLDSDGLDVRSDDLPRVSPWQQSQLVARQYAYHFPKAVMGGSAVMRRNGMARAQHAGMANDERISPALEALYHIGNPVQPLGFYALECAAISEDLADVPQENPVLRLFLGEATGLRQVVIKDGAAVLTRVHTDLSPSQASPELAGEIAEHIKTTLGFLPRLGIDGNGIAVQLFVPPMLKDIGMAPELQAQRVRVIALEAPTASHANSAGVPPAFELDLALLARVAGRRKPALPFAPDWLKSRHNRLVLREDVSILMFVFGVAGLAFGLITLFKPPKIVQIPAPAPLMAMEQPAAPKPVEPMPPMKLDAVIYNGPNDWTVWINGDAYRPGETKNDITVVDASAQDAHVKWQKGDARQEVFLNLQNDVRLIGE